MKKTLKKPNVRVQEAFQTCVVVMINTVLGRFKPDLGMTYNISKRRNGR